MKCIVTCSGKGGTGKSCVAAYTGAALAKAGKKTLLVELGATDRSLELILDVKDAAFGAIDFFAERCDAEDAMVRVEKFPGLLFMPSGGGQPSQGEGKIQMLLEAAREYDFIIVDGADLSALPVKLCDVFLLVVTPDTLSVQAAAYAAGHLYKAGAKEVRLVINNVPPRIIPIKGAEDFDDVIDIVGAQLIGVIPTSQKLAYSSNNAQPLDPDSLTVKIFENLAARLMGHRRPLLIR